MSFSKDYLKYSIRKLVNKFLTEKEKNKEPEEEIFVASEEEMEEMMDIMDANLNIQNNPKVGIFWYDPIDKIIFGVVKLDAYSTAETSKINKITCSELHKNIWKNNYNDCKYRNSSDFKYYNGDYKNTPRGRIFYLKEEDEFHIMVGSWIHEYLEAIKKIKEVFNLNDPNLLVRVVYGIHWDIGMGYGE